MQRLGSRHGWAPLRLTRWLVLLLLVGGCAHSGRTEPVCTSQNSAVLIEIITGQLDYCAPATAQWERELARDCGWIEQEDFR